MSAVDIRVAELCLEGFDAAPDQVGPVLERAFRILAERIAQRGDVERVERLYVEALQVEFDSPEALLGPRGPEMIAEKLFRCLLDKRH